MIGGAQIFQSGINGLMKENGIVLTVVCWYRINGIRRRGKI